MKPVESLLCLNVDSFRRDEGDVKFQIHVCTGTS